MIFSYVQWALDYICRRYITFFCVKKASRKNATRNNFRIIFAPTAFFKINNLYLILQLFQLITVYLHLKLPNSSPSRVHMICLRKFTFFFVKLGFCFDLLRNFIKIYYLKISHSFSSCFAFFVNCSSFAITWMNFLNCSNDSCEENILKSKLI